MLIFGFAFELVKIAIQSSVYALLLLLACAIIADYKPSSWIAIISKKKLRFWFISYIVISFSLLVYMFTPGGDHGLGDYAQIPIGHSKIVHQIDGYDVYIESENGNQQSIGIFAYDKAFLYAQANDPNNDKKGDFVIWNLETDEWKYFDSKETYMIEASIKNYPSPDQFKDFDFYYNQYWNGWRFWVLP